MPPCGQPTNPAFGPIDSPPNIFVWFGEDKSEAWPPPKCLGWAPRSFASMVAVAGRFRNPAGMPALASRVGAISAATDIRYWSVSRQEWRAFFVDAQALRTPNPETTRGNFTNDEVHAGAQLHFLQKENNPIGPVVYRLSVRERDEDRLVLSVTNVSQVRLLLIPIFDVGEQESVTFLFHERGDSWRYYSLARLGGAPDYPTGPP